nr:ATP-binding protein [Frondihabitans sp. VKM Ac-2883]
MTVHVDEIARQQLLLWSLVGLVSATLLAAVVGWLVAGRMLKPIRMVTAAAGRISAEDLHERIAHDGPDDELKNLADTFDGLLARLEVTFESQRRFVANASHELRTPLAIQRTAIQVGLADPTPENVVATAEQLLTANRRSERLLSGLLALAKGQRGLSRTEEVDLATVVAEQVDMRRERTSADSTTLRVRLDETRVTGDPVLLGQLVGNLLDNALDYTLSPGAVQIDLVDRFLRIRNSGAVIDPPSVESLFEPFVRLDRDRDSAGAHAGLGLSIVQSISEAHGFTVKAQAPTTGGLVVELALT